MPRAYIEVSYTTLARLLALDPKVPDDIVVQEIRRPREPADSILVVVETKSVGDVPDGYVLQCLTRLFTLR